MRTSTQEKIKPSTIHSNPDLLKDLANKSNQRRNERKIKMDQERMEQERKDQEFKERMERMMAEEREAQKETKKEPKKETPKSGNLGKKIKTSVDGVEFDSLAKSMAYIDPIQWGKENDYRTSCWIKINRTLKKDGVCIYNGHEYKLI